MTKEPLVELIEMVRASINVDSFQRNYHDRGVVNCSCGADKSPDHFYKCPVAWERWKKVKKDKSTKFPVTGKDKQLKWMLGHPKGSAMFAKFVEDTRFFEDI